MVKIGKIDLKDIVRRRIFQPWCAPPRAPDPERAKDMRFDYLLGAAAYAALAVAALAGAWLLVDALGGAVPATFPLAPTRLFG